MITTILTVTVCLLALWFPPLGYRRAVHQGKHLDGILASALADSSFAIHYARGFNAPYGVTPTPLFAVFMMGYVTAGIRNEHGSAELLRYLPGLAVFFVILLFLLRDSKKRAPIQLWTSLRSAAFEAAMYFYFAIALSTGYVFIYDQIIRSVMRTTIRRHADGLIGRATLDLFFSHAGAFQAIILFCALLLFCFALLKSRSFYRQWTAHFKDVVHLGEFEEYRGTESTPVVGLLGALAAAVGLWSGLFYALLSLPSLYQAITTGQLEGLSRTIRQGTEAFQSGEANRPSLYIGTATLLFLTSHVLAYMFWAIRLPAVGFHLLRVRVEQARVSKYAIITTDYADLLSEINPTSRRVQLRIHLSPTDRPEAYSLLGGSARSSPKASRHLIVLSEGLLKRFPRRHIEVILAHEVAHCVLHHRTMRRYRWLSLLLFCDRNALSPLINFPKLEEEADRRASQLLGNTDAAREDVRACLETLRGYLPPGEDLHRGQLVMPMTNSPEAAHEGYAGFFRSTLAGIKLIASGHRSFYQHPSYRARIARLRW